MLYVVHFLLYMVDFVFLPLLSKCVTLQGGEDSQDALSCRSYFAKEPLIIGLFGRKTQPEAVIAYHFKVGSLREKVNPFPSRH